MGYRTQLTFAQLRPCLVELKGERLGNLEGRMGNKTRNMTCHWAVVASS